MDREKAMKKAGALVCWYRKHREWMSLAERSLRALYMARDGNPARVVAAGATIAASVVEKAFPETSMEEDLRQRGYHLLDTPVGGLLCDILAQNGTPTAEIEKSHNERAKLWERKREGAAAVYYNDEYQSGPYILGGDEGFLLEAVMRQVWSRRTDLMLTTNPDINIRKGSKRFSLVPIPDPGPYIGEPGPKYYAERLARYGNRPRTMLIKGPSGIGKSVLARHIASLAASGSSKTLKIAGNALSSFGSAELRDIARFLQPSVMLLDDLNISDEGHRSRNGVRLIDTLLDVLEALRVEGCLVIATMMVDTNAEADRYRGDDYVEGMRPGRIDEIVTMYAPDDVQRKIILEHYYDFFGMESPDGAIQKVIVKMTDGLTGAYLREVAERINVHGIEHISSEIEAILQASPPLKPILRRPARGRISRPRRIPRTAKKILSEAKRLERNAKNLRKQADKCDKSAKKRIAEAEKKAEKERNEMEERRVTVKTKAKKKTVSVKKKVVCADNANKDTDDIVDVELKGGAVLEALKEIADDPVKSGFRSEFSIVKRSGKLVILNPETRRFEKTTKRRSRRAR